MVASRVELRALNSDQALIILGDSDGNLGLEKSKQKRLDEACKQYLVLHENTDPPRRDVIGLAYYLITFAVATHSILGYISKVALENTDVVTPDGGNKIKRQGMIGSRTKFHLFHLRKE